MRRIAKILLYIRNFYCNNLNNNNNNFFLKYYLLLIFHRITVTFPPDDGVLSLGLRADSCTALHLRLKCNGSCRLLFALFLGINSIISRGGGGGGLATTVSLNLPVSSSSAGWSNVVCSSSSSPLPYSNASWQCFRAMCIAWVTSGPGWWWLDDLLTSLFLRILIRRFSETPLRAEWWWMQSSLAGASLLASKVLAVGPEK